MAVKAPLSARISRPLFWLAVVVFVLAWIALKGGPSVERFAHSEVAPGVAGFQFQPDKPSQPPVAVLTWPGAEGWDQSWIDRIKALNGAGALVLYIDYYQGGRDSFHGAPNEWNADLWGRWRQNLQNALVWFNNHNPEDRWGLLVRPGRGEALRSLLGEQVSKLPVLDPGLSADAIVRQLQQSPPLSP